MKQFYCPYLGSEVELTDERLFHIIQRHPDVEKFLPKISDVLLKPELIRQKDNVLLFSMFLTDIKKYVVVVIKNERIRSFIITCYLTLKIKGGNVIWMKES